MKHSIVYATALVALIGTARASEFDSPKQVVVHYGDIQVAQSAGAEILMARLDSAAKDVCGPAPSSMDLTGWKLFKACTMSTTDRAVASLPFNVSTKFGLPVKSETVASR